mmetsp:Transcript_17467/g.15402  ORF Transcript_17467/g.15402 Transcript_17467/m.15402 type:complete len:113 (+) Transcript_17467:931-1269(+)
MLLKTNIDNVNYKLDIKVLRGSVGLSEDHSKSSLFILSGQGKERITSYLVESRVRPMSIEEDQARLLSEIEASPSTESLEESEETNPEKFREGFNRLIKINYTAERKLIIDS